MNRLGHVARASCRESKKSEKLGYTPATWSDSTAGATAYPAWAAQRVLSGGFTRGPQFCRTAELSGVFGRPLAASGQQPLARRRERGVPRTRERTQSRWSFYGKQPVKVLRGEEWDQGPAEMEQGLRTSSDCGQNPKSPRLLIQTPEPFGDEGRLVGPFDLDRDVPGDLNTAPKILSPTPCCACVSGHRTAPG